MDERTDVGPVISEDRWRRILAYVEEALGEGARLLCGGKVPEDPVLRGGGDTTCCQQRWTGCATRCGLRRRRFSDL